VCCVKINCGRQFIYIYIYGQSRPIYVENLLNIVMYSAYRCKHIVEFFGTTELSHLFDAYRDTEVLRYMQSGGTLTIGKGQIYEQPRQFCNTNTIIVQCLRRFCYLNCLKYLLKE
jgi:hypothetical protein